MEGGKCGTWTGVLGDESGADSGDSSGSTTATRAVDDILFGKTEVAFDPDISELALRLSTESASWLVSTVGGRKAGALTKVAWLDALDFIETLDLLSFLDVELDTHDRGLPVSTSRSN
jgi:hypothetical protein